MKFKVHIFCTCAFRVSRIHAYPSHETCPLTYSHTIILRYILYSAFCNASPRRENSLSCKAACALSQGYKAKRVGKRIAGMCYYIRQYERRAKYVKYIKVACVFLGKLSFRWSGRQKERSPRVAYDRTQLQRELM